MTVSSSRLPERNLLIPKKIIVSEKVMNDRAVWWWYTINVLISWYWLLSWNVEIVFSHMIAESEISACDVQIDKGQNLALWCADWQGSKFHFVMCKLIRVQLSFCDVQLDKDQNFKGNEKWKMKHPSDIDWTGFEPRCYRYVADCTTIYAKEVSGSWSCRLCIYTQRLNILK